MRAPENSSMQAIALGRYALFGVLALALSLAGVMGGHHLLGKAFGLGDRDETFAYASAQDDAPECPAHLQAADACDYDGETTGPDEEADGCGTDHDEEADATPGVRYATAGFTTLATFVGRS